MKKAILFFFLFGAILSVKAQQDTAKKEYLIKYEVLTKKGEKILINYFDRDGKVTGATASESWIYNFTTTDKNQNIQVDAVAPKRVSVKINIYVNGNLIKSVEEKNAFLLGPTAQVNLNEIK